MKIIGSILNLVSYGLTFWAGGAFTLAWMLFDRSGGLTPGELMQALSLASVLFPVGFQVEEASQ
jgi:hypothetical protein